VGEKVRFESLFYVGVNLTFKTKKINTRRKLGIVPACLGLGLQSKSKSAIREAKAEVHSYFIYFNAET
jgi:hypothetical protein